MTNRCGSSLTGLLGIGGIAGNWFTDRSLSAEGGSTFSPATVKHCPPWPAKSCRLGTATVHPLNIHASRVNRQFVGPIHAMLALTERGVQLQGPASEANCNARRVPGLTIIAIIGGPWPSESHSTSKRDSQSARPP